jgi:hypothetical protein
MHSASSRMSRMNVRLKNRVRISGRPGAPVVVLAHGFGCDQNMWRGRTAEEKVRDLAARLRQPTVPILTRLIKAKSEAETVHLPGERRLHLG